MTDTIMMYKHKMITLLLLMLKPEIYLPRVIIGIAIVAAYGNTVKTGCSTTPNKKLPL